MMPIATALSQCMIRTQPGWIVLLAGAACSWLTVRVDIGCSVAGVIRYPHYTPGTGISLHASARIDTTWPLTVHKKASRVAPARRRVSRWGVKSGHAYRYDGIRTVSTTWITPFDWL